MLQRNQRNQKNQRSKIFFKKVVTSCNCNCLNDTI